MKITTRIVAMIAAAGLAPVALAQNQGQNYGQNQQNQNENQQNQSQQNGAWVPAAGKIVGYDLNGDGQVDALYAVTDYEYQKLQQDQQAGNGQPMRGHILGQPINQGGWGMRQGQNRQWSMNPSSSSLSSMNHPGDRQFNGTLTDVTTFSFANDNQRHTVGKLQLQNGATIPVHFGISSNLPTQLSAGDQVTVIGHEGTLDDRRIILADRVIDQQGSFALNQQDQRGQNNQFGAQGQSGSQGEQWNGTILATRTLPLQNGDKALLAQIRTPYGTHDVVDLGPVSNLENRGAKPQQGDQVSVIGRSSIVNGHPIVIADQFSDNGQSVSVNPARSRLLAAPEFQRTYRHLRNRGGNQGGGNQGGGNQGQQAGSGS